MSDIGHDHCKNGHFTMSKFCHLDFYLLIVNALSLWHKDWLALLVKCRIMCDYHLIIAIRENQEGNKM